MVGKDFEYSQNKIKPTPQNGVGLNFFWLENPPGIGINQQVKSHENRKTGRS